MADTADKTSLDIAVIGGDGIGPEVVAEGLKVLEVAAGDVKVSTTEYDLGAARWHRTGETLPASVVEELKGPRRHPPRCHRRPDRAERRARARVLLPLRFAMDHYVNLRPAKLYPGVASPLDVARVARTASTSSSSARAPRARMSATVARCASTPRTRSRPRSASTPGMAWSGSCAMPSRAPRRARAST